MPSSELMIEEPQITSAKVKAEPAPASAPAPVRKPPRKLLLGVVIGVAAIATAATLAAMNSSNRSAAAAGKEQPNAKAEKPPVPVTVAPVEWKPVVRSIDAVGTFQGFEDIVVTPKVAGRVLKIYHDVQDFVHPGERLADIDRTDYELAMQEAQRALASELAKIGLATLPPENLRVEDFLAGLPSYQRALDMEQNWLAKRGRAEKLIESHAISKEELDQTKTEHKVARDNRDQVAMDALATLATARHKAAQLRTAQQKLDDTCVMVPLPAGTSGDQASIEYSVAERLVSEGEMVNQFMPKGTFRLVIKKKLKLQACIPERYAGQVKLGLAVQIRVEAYPDRVFPGEVKRITPVVDPVSRTFQVEVHVPNADGLLMPGGFAKLAIVTRTDGQALTVPIEAVVSFAGVDKVFVIRDGKARTLEVSTGIEGRDGAQADGKRWIEIDPQGANELTAGAKVITSGHTQLADGVAVRVRE